MALRGSLEGPQVQVKAGPPPTAGSYAADPAAGFRVDVTVYLKEQVRCVIDTETGAPVLGGRPSSAAAMG
jgi:hypothetical protein